MEAGIEREGGADRISVRPYRAEDFAAVYQLDELCFAPEFRFSPAAMQRFVSARRARAFVAETDGGQLAGVVVLHMENEHGQRRAYVVTLDVDPRLWRNGVGAALMRRSEAQAMQEDCRAVMLHVSTENAGAIRFYERMGYDRGHTVENFYGEGLDAAVYRKPLQRFA